MGTFRTGWIALLLCLAAACGSSIDDKGKGIGPAPNNAANNTSNNTSNNVATNNVATNGTSATCGDGVFDAGELCDPGIVDGVGACPTSCEAPSCATASLVGNATSCTAQCIVEAAACASGDGCCPAGCDTGTDSDCTNACGNGLIEGPETCDGDCPTQCSDGNLCTTDALVGSAAACNAACSFAPISACASGDGCCPAGCTSDRDNDCTPTAACGDGVVNPGELCDGNCPTSCNDGAACTIDVMSGTAAACNARCSNTPITACVSGDGCCAPGCTYQNDNDCACVRRTCAQMGAECGQINDGCGGTVTCTDTCSAIEVCTQNRCAAENYIGQDCNDFPDCGSLMDAACILPPSWPGGYCSLICNSATNTSCPSGSHCADFDGQNSLCMLNCTSSAQCEAGYVCRQFDGLGGLECVPPEPVGGSGHTGDACLSDQDCTGGLVCEQEINIQGVITTFPGGVCTETCLPIVGTCSETNAVCSIDSLCMTSCIDSTDCRAGWSCQFGIPPLSMNHCWPN